MTVNERFFALGVLDEFDRAFRARDRAAMIVLYRNAEVDDAEDSVDFMLAHPERYGFNRE